MEDPAEVGPRLGEWVAKRFGNGARVARCQTMEGDASTRRYVRVWLDGPGAPETLVAMVMADGEGAVTSEEIGGKVESEELDYVNVHHFLVRCGVAVPELYLDASQEGVLLLEDIGAMPLWDAVENAPEVRVRELFGRAIEQLLRIQIDGTAKRDDGCVGFQRSFDRRLYNWEFDHFLEWGFTGRLEGDLPKSEIDELQRHFGAISNFLDEQPRVLNHRDYHAWNLFVQGEEVRVIDFQDALLAAAPYDLATLLGDRVTPHAVPPHLEKVLVADYAAAWAAHPAAPWTWDEEGLWQVYTSCALQKAFKVVGRFHYLDRVKGKPGYLRFLPPTLKRIGVLLAGRPDLHRVREILQQYFPELGS